MMSHDSSRLLRACALLVLSTACASTTREPQSAVAQGEAGALPGQHPGGRSEYVLADDVSVRRIARGVWIHTTLGSGEYGHYPANGLVIEDSEGTILVDTGWNAGQAERLLAWAQEELRLPVRAAVVTHSHDDRTGGVPALVARGLPVYGLEETSRLAAARGEPIPSHTFAGSRALGSLELFFPGAGHSRDNLVVWHRDSGALFGGCFVKDAAAKGLGNVADADMTEWPASLERTRTRFRDARIVVPGHGLPGGPELLRHTEALLHGTATAR